MDTAKKIVVLFIFLAGLFATVYLVYHNQDTGDSGFIVEEFLAEEPSYQPTPTASIQVERVNLVRQFIRSRYFKWTVVAVGLVALAGGAVLAAWLAGLFPSVKPPIPQEPVKQEPVQVFIEQPPTFSSRLGKYFTDSRNYFNLAGFIAIWVVIGIFVVVDVVITVDCINKSFGKSRFYMDFMHIAVPFVTYIGFMCGVFVSRGLGWHPAIGYVTSCAVVLVPYLLMALRWYTTGPIWPEIVKVVMLAFIALILAVIVTFIGNIFGVTLTLVVAWFGFSVHLSDKLKPATG